jgi:hypothetical protein
MIIDNEKKLMDLAPGSKVSVIGGRILWEPPVGGIIFDGRDQRGNAKQDEDQEPMLWIAAPVVFLGNKNSRFFFRNNKESIRVKDGGQGTEFHWIVFEDAGEDCISTNVGNISIFDSEFTGFRPDNQKLHESVKDNVYNDKEVDKCLQLNMADGVKVINCKFRNFAQSFALGNSTYGRPDHRAHIENIEMWNITRWGVHANRTRVTYKNVKFNNVKQHWHSEGGATFNEVK